MVADLTKVLLLVSILGTATTAAADIYSYIDREGVIHFTNIPRPGRKWRRIMRTGPGKARVVHARRRRKLSKARYHRYDQDIADAAAHYRIPAPLVRAVIAVESDFDPQAVSRVGAAGLMQLMPATAKAMGVAAVHDPRANIFGGTRYLRLMANRFAGDLRLTLAAYHAGPGAVIKYGRSVPPYATTRQYLKLVLRRYRRYRKRLGS